MTAPTTSGAPAAGRRPRRKLTEHFAFHAASALGTSILQQVVGLLRQILVAAFFGLSRDLDGYIVVFGLATMLVFNLSGVFDTVVVSRLVQLRERDGEDAFWCASNRVLWQALAVGVLFAASFSLVLWLALPIITAGFTAAERAYVAHVGWYFLPWIAVIVPYYAVSAHLKSTWRFSWVFGSEILTIVVSILVLLLDHSSVVALPIAYSTGYLVSFLLLLWRRGLRASHPAQRPGGLMPSMSKQYLAIQVGTATGFADRYFQSFLMPGGISALGYVGLIVNNLSSLLTFREIYIVPLSVEEGRERRLERMLQGIVLVSIPCALFFVVYAEPVVSVLLQRGKFTPEAAAVTAMVLRIQALTLLISTMVSPLERIFQILDRLSFTQLRYLAAFFATLIFQSLFVFYLGLDVQGVAWGGLCSSFIILLMVILLVRRCGVVVRWRGVFGNAAFAAATAAVAMGLSWLAASRYRGLLELIIGGGVYGVVLAASYFMASERLGFVIGWHPRAVNGGRSEA